MGASQLLSHWVQWAGAPLHGEQVHADLSTPNLGPAPWVEAEDGMLCVDHEVGNLRMQAQPVARVEVSVTQGLLWSRQMALWTWSWKRKRRWALLWLQREGAAPGLAVTGARAALAEQRKRGCASCTAAATWRRTSSGRGKYTSVARWEEEEVELRSGVVGSAVMCTTAAVFPWLDVWLGCDASPRCAASP